MNKVSTYITAVFFAAFCMNMPAISHAQAVSATPVICLSLGDAIFDGLTKNPDLKMAITEEQKQCGELDEAKTKRNFTIVGEASQTRNKSETDYTFDGTKIVLTQQDQSTLTLGIQQNIDIAGKISTAVSIADFESIAAKLNTRAVRNNVVAQIKSAYLDCLRAQAMAKATQQDEQNARDRLHYVEAQVNAGITPKMELLRAQTALASQQNTAFVAQRDIELSLAQLKKTIGLLQSTMIAVSEEGVADIFPDEPASDYTPQIERAEVLEAHAHVEAAKRGIGLSKQSILPDFVIGVGMTATPNASAFGSSSNAAQITATFSMPIYDGGLAKARETQARASVDAAQAHLEETQQSIDLDVTQARIRVSNSQARLAATQAALNEAKEAYRLANIRFTQGVSALIEVSDAQTALTQAQTDDINAHWELLSARNSYKRAIGSYEK